MIRHGTSHVWTLKLQLAILLILLAPTAGAGWVSLDGLDSPAEPRVTILSETPSEVVLEVELPGFWSEEVSEAGETYHRLELPGEDHLRRVGSPELPRLVRLLTIPGHGHPVVELDVLDEVSLDGYRIYPAQPPLTDAEKAGEFRLDPVAYAASDLYPPEPARLGEPGLWRELRVVSLELSPLSWQASDGHLVVARRLRATVRTSGVGGANERLGAPRPVSPDWDRLYRSSLLNYGSADLDVLGGSRDGGPYYLMVTHDDYVAALQPLAQWYHNAGFTVDVAPLSEVGAGFAAIKTKIQNTYDIENLEYVLLVGDISQVAIGSYSGDASDHQYTMLAGGDDYPDIALGRFSVMSSADLEHQILRTLNYLDDPEAGTFYEDTILVAHEEEYPGKYTQCKNEIFAYSYSLQVPIFEKIYPPEGGTKQQVIDAMVSGLGVVNYRGHGDTTEWSWSPGWVNSDVLALQNGNRTPHVLNIACNNGELDSSGACLAEAMLSAGSNGEHGYVTALGATRPSYTIENHDFDKRMYRAIYDEGITRIGDVVNAGKETTIAMGASGTFNAQIYLILGDPACDVRTLDPLELTVDLPPSIPPGPFQFGVTVSALGSPLEGALVAASMEPDVHQAVYTDFSGSATLSVTAPEPGDMTITVTAHNARPVTRTLVVSPPDCGIVRWGKAELTCNEMATVTLWETGLNLDPGLVDQALVTVSSDSEPVPEELLLLETGPDTSEFQGEIQLADTHGGPGFLLVGHGDQLTVTYQDEECEGAPQTVTHQASLDCQGPVITGVEATDVVYDGATIQWDTDEPASTVLWYGPEVPCTEQVIDAALRTEHRVDLTELEDCTFYHFYVAGEDGAGNQSVEDNSGLYYRFCTLGREVLIDEDMDSDPGWTVQGQWAWGQPTGGGGEHGNPDPTSGHTGSNVCGFNLNGDYSDSMPVYYLTTPAMDCSEGVGVLLSFARWLGVESPSYDHAGLQISVNGGGSWSTIWENTGSMDGGSWEMMQYDLSAWADGQADVRLRWSMGPTDSSWTWCGWNIDDVMVMYDTDCDLPTPTPFATSTPTPTPSPIATSTPAPTDTPVPTDTPEPSPTPDVVYGVRLDLPTMAHPGENFWVMGLLDNPGTARSDVPVFFLLEAFGSYYFWPSWCCYAPPESQEFDYRLLPVVTGTSEVVVLPTFPWPDTGAEAVDGLTFLGAMLTPDMQSIEGEMAIVPWGYGP